MNRRGFCARFVLWCTLPSTRTRQRNGIDNGNVGDEFRVRFDAESCPDGNAGAIRFDNGADHNSRRRNTWLGYALATVAVLDGPVSRRQSLPRSGGILRQVAVHLPDSPVCRLAVACGSRANSKPSISRSGRLGLCFRLRLSHQKQHNANHREHPRGCVLTVPRFRLPHQEPFAAHIQERNQP